jgi:hypothetical protein
MADRCVCASTWPYFKQRSDDGLEVGLNFSGDFLQIVSAAPKPRKASWEGVTIHAQNNASNATLYQSLPFDLRRDLIPIAAFSRGLAERPSYRSHPA